jgi:hypothetical protein
MAGLESAEAPLRVGGSNPRFPCRAVDCFRAEPVISARALLRSSGARIRATRWLAMTVLQHLMHVDLDAVGMPCADADEHVLHQPAIFFVTGFEFRHRAEIDQRGIDGLALGDAV